MGRISQPTWFSTPVHCNEEAIRNVEQRLGVTLPQDYREFLATGGGGAPNETDFIINEPRGPFDASVGIFLSAADDRYGILTTLTLVEPRRITGLVPIAEGGGGDLVCLDYRNGSVPVMAYWHHGRCGLDDEVVAFCDSFAEFLNLLRRPLGE
jgi:hypothetical protein